MGPNDRPLKPEDYEEPQCLLCMRDDSSDTPKETLPIRRIMDRLDEYLDRGDTVSAERHLKNWLAEADAFGDTHAKLTLLGETMGLMRKLGRKEEAYGAAADGVSLSESIGLSDTVSGATTYINAATVYSAFGDPSRAIPLYDRAEVIYTSSLPPDDPKLGGLYNNRAIALSAVGRFADARSDYLRALRIMEHTEHGELEQAITWLNLADTEESEHGADAAAPEIRTSLDRAQDLLDTIDLPRDGYYAFVARKCAPAFRHHGMASYADLLEKRAEKIDDRP